MTLRKTALLLVITAATAGHAQLGVYAGFSSSKLTTPDVRLNGGTVGLYYDRSRHPLVNFGVDVRATVLPEKNFTRVTAITAGPRMVFHLPVVPLRPYGEALLGGAHATVGQGYAFRDRTSFAGGVAAGADLRILPFIDWRVLEYSYTRLQAVPTGSQTLTTGLVIRIPFS